MSLQSNLFKGDAKLEACLAQDSAHVTEGAAGEHVAKIHAALRILNQPRIDAAEVTAKLYGKTTSSSVLAYKTNRGIINRSYQSRPDAIVGKMTVAALDRELRALEGPTSSKYRLCGCRDLSGGYYSNGPVAAPVRSSRLMLAIAVEAAPGGQDTDVVKLALSFVPEALTWVNSAIAALDRLIGSSLTRDQVVKTVDFRRVQRHFHVPERIAMSPFNKLLGWLLPGFQDDPVLAVLKAIRFRFWDIRAGLLRAKDIFRFHDNTGEGDEASVFVPTVRDGNIYITPIYRLPGKLSHPRILIHETVHWLGPDFQEWAIRDRSRVPENQNPRAYIDLPWEFAIKNPDSYAYFAFETATGNQNVINQDD